MLKQVATDSLRRLPGWYGVRALWRQRPTAVLVGLMIISAPGFSLADGVLAVGLPNGDPGNGYVAGFSANRSNADAEAEAMKGCKGVDVRDTSKAKAVCKIVARYKNECANDALNGDNDTPSTAVGWAVAADSKTANSNAMQKCEEMRKGKGKACHLGGDPICDGTAK